MGGRRISKAAIVAAALSVAVHLVAPLPACADGAAPEPSSDGRTFATLVVNHEARGDYLVQIKNGDVFVRADDLRAAGLLVPPGARGPDGYVRIADLAPAVASQFDADGPVVRLDAAQARSLAHHSSVGFAGQPPDGAKLTNERSGYLNYSVRDATGGGWSGAQELALSDAAKTFYSSGAFDSRGFRRGLTNLTWDNPAKLRRIVAGDTFGDSGDLGSTVLLGGVSVSKSYSLNPYDPRASSPVVYGSVLVPSTADVRVNGQLVRTIELPPGTFDLRNLPASGGLTDASIVVHDAFGRTQIFSAKYYGAASVLKPGATDYAYAVGDVRGAAGSAGGYAGMAALGRYAVGVTATTTLGAHAEFASGLENSGASVDHAGRVGVTHAAIAESRAGGSHGYAASFGHTFGTSRLWGTASVLAATPGYTTVAQRVFFDRQTLDVQLSVGVRPFSAQYTSTLSLNETHSLLGGRARQIAWEHALPLAGGASLYVSTGMARTAGLLHPTFSLLLQRPLGRSGQTTVNESVASDGGSTQPVTELRRSSPTALGMQYDARFLPAGPLAASGSAEFRSVLGSIVTNYTLQRGTGSSADIAWSGSLAFAGGYAHLAQPIADGFTLVKVDGGQRARVLADNQEFGSTDRNGIVVVPNTRSYYAQRIGIVDDNGPVNMTVTNQEAYVMPGYRHGSAAHFTAALVSAIVGRVAIRDGARAIVPAFGELTLSSGGTTFTSNLDEDGRFYLENAAPATYHATIRYADGECRFAVVVPLTTTPEQNIGAFTCKRS